MQAISPVRLLQINTALDEHRCGEVLRLLAECADGRDDYVAALSDLADKFIRYDLAKAENYYKLAIKVYAECGVGSFRPVLHSVRCVTLIMEHLERSREIPEFLEITKAAVQRAAEDALQDANQRNPAAAEIAHGLCEHLAEG